MLSLFGPPCKLASDCFAEFEVQGVFRG